MGCFSCFDSSDDEKLNPVDESNHGQKKQSQPTVSNNISGLPSGFDLLICAFLCFNPLSLHAHKIWLFDPLVKLTGLDLNHCYFGFMSLSDVFLSYWACSDSTVFLGESVILCFNFTCFDLIGKSLACAQCKFCVLKRNRTL
jgi:hypothetical protein